MTETKKLLEDGTRHLSILFEQDGHFLQKTRADFIAQSIDFVLNNNKGGVDVKSR